MSKDKRIDQYIKAAPAHAKPLLTHLRKFIHANCPSVEETIKWGAPWYMYQNKVLCGTVAFKNYSVLLFNARLRAAKNEEQKAAIIKLRRIDSVAALPKAQLLKTILKQAMALNEPGAKPAPKKPRVKKPPVKTPPNLMRALKTNAKALAKYKEFSESHQRHYVEWIADAKTDATRQARLTKAVKCIAAGKTRHWL